MLNPSIAEVKKQLETYKMVPVFYEILSDNCSPIHIYYALRHLSKTSFILESVDNGKQWGRYSFIGVNPKRQIKMFGNTIEDSKNGTFTTFNPIDYLKSLIEEYQAPRLKNRPKLTGGLIGYFGYDTIRYMEPQLSDIPTDDLHMPDCHLGLYDEIVAFDHLSNKAVIIINIHKGENVEDAYTKAEQTARTYAKLIAEYTHETSSFKGNQNLTVTSNLTKEEFEQNVLKAKEYIQNGDIFQVVLSRRFEIANHPDPFHVYRCLRSANPSPYLYYFELGDYQIAGASPEMLVNVTDGKVLNRPIAGTVPRGKDEEEDQKLERLLLNDPKERAEHTMLVDLGRNDVGKVCKFGSVNVPEYMKLERYSQVTHLVSLVEGTLQDDKTALDALMSILPAGTLSGAPKIRAMSIIDELENQKRGLYGGIIGYLGFDGNIDTCIAIRTVLFKDNKAYVQAGAGIVADSDPEKEYIESENKALAVINAIKEASAL